MKIVLGLPLALLLAPAVVFRQATPVVGCSGHDHDHDHDHVNHEQPFHRDLQEEVADEDGYCGFAEPSPEEVRDVQRKMQSWKLGKAHGRGKAAKDKRSLAGSEDETIAVPTYFHVITETEGGLGSEAIGKVGEQMDVLNSAFAPYGFYFNLTDQTQTVSKKWFDLSGMQSLINPNGWQDQSEMALALRRGGRNALNVYTTGLPRTSGFAQFPTILDTADAHIDGVMLRWNTLPGLDTNPKWDMGYTLVHEVGHWLGLFHTHMGTCSCGGDMVDDTPAIAAPNRKCLPEGYDSCPSQPGTDPIHNYMGYSWDSCYEEFTPGQVERMRFFWETLREPEKYGYGGGSDGEGGVDASPAADVPEADFLPCSPDGTGHYVEIDLKTDFWGIETTWDIVDAATGEAVVKSMGGFGAETDYHFGPYCLLPGVYTFTIYDAGMNGIQGSSWGNGKYTVTMDGKAKPLNRGVGKFECSDSTDFVVVVEEEEEEEED